MKFRGEPMNFFAAPDTALETTADFSQGDVVVRTGRIFRVGNYPDKQFSLSDGEAEKAVATFSPAAMNYEHKPGLLDGHFGSIQKIWKQGQEVWGQIGVPKWLHDLATDQNIPLKVSAEWNRSTKALTGAAWVLNPRIKDAELAAAFSQTVSHNRWQSCLPQGVQNMNKLEKKIREMFAEKGFEVGDDVEALFSTERATVAKNDAKTFVSALLKDKKIVPAESELVAALFAQAAQDDAASETTVTFSQGGKAKTGNRCDLLKAVFTARTPHTLTEEVVEDEDANFSDKSPKDKKKTKLEDPNAIYKRRQEQLNKGGK